MAFQSSVIPADLIPIILELGDFWACDLTSLARTSLSWLFYARRALYSSIALSTYPSCSLLARTFRENQSLCVLARSIQLCPTFAGGRSRVVSAGLADIRFVLSTLDNLSHITLGASLVPGAHQYLNIVPNPGVVTSLSIHGVPWDESASECAPGSLEWDECLSEKFCGLRSLKLAHLELEIISPLPRLEVSSLHLEHICLLHGSIAELAATPALKFVRIVSDGISGGLEEQLQVLLDSSLIEELHYEVERNKPHDREFTFLPLEETCTSVKHLSIGGTHLCLPMVRLIGESFPSLQELFLYGRATFVTPEEWQLLLQSSSLPALRTLSIPDGTCHPPYRKWDASAKSIVRLGERRGLELSIRDA